MKSCRYALLLATLSLSLLSCDKENFEAPTGQLIIGSAAGRCLGDCAQLYLIDGDQVYRELNLQQLQRGQPVSDAQFDTQALDSIDVSVLDSLRATVPNLASYSREDFGCPDCADGGSLLVAVYDGTSWSPFYFLDTSTGSMSTAELRDYGDLLERAIRAWRR